MSDDGYEVGYKRPPKHTQFQKGRSGNPNGRPKGTRNLKTDLLEELAETIVIREGERPRQVSKQRAFVKTLMAKALKGDMRAAAPLLRLMEVHDEKPQRREGLTINVVGQFDDSE